PVDRATVRALLNEDRDGNFLPVEGVTDGEGRYHLDGLEAGTYRAEVASPEGGFVSAKVAVRPGINRLDFTFPGGEVAGRVLGRGGAPIPDAVATLLPAVPSGVRPHTVGRACRDPRRRAGGPGPRA